jgi:hypothetical protein
LLLRGNQMDGHGEFESLIEFGLLCARHAIVITCSTPS